MSKPPRTPPHSDLDGVHEDRHDIVAAAIEAGQDAADLKRAKRNSVGRPKTEGDDGAEERSR